jgi:tyrosinase
VRAACGDRSFTMPYWNYLESKTAGILPAPFRDPKSPLYNPDRRPAGHPGSGVNNGEWVPNASVTYDCLGLSDYYSADAVPPNFSSTINNNPHGIMHDQIGNEFVSDLLRAGMSFIPTAAGDPIFFLHHCNIDRIWASWNAGGNKNPDHDPNWAAKRFTFANAQGQVAEYVVGKYSDIKTLGYSYEKLEPVPAAAAVVAAAGPTVKGIKPLTVGNSLAIRLSGTVLTVPLAAAPGQTLLRATPGGAKVYLVVEGLRIDRLPGTQYDIFLGAPKGATGDALKPYYVGTPSFFEAAGMPGMGQDFTFDVSALAARLQKQGNAAPVVTIVPRGGAPMPGSNPAIAKISLVRQ